MDDLNLIVSPKEINDISVSLTNEFEMKDLGQTKFCLGLQIEHLKNRIMLHQSTYTQKIIKQFNIDCCHPLSTPMVVRSLEVTKDLFRPLEEKEKILGPEILT